MMLGMNKQFFAIIVLVIAALVGVFAITSHKNKNNSGSTNSNAQPSSHISGKTDSKVTLVEYGDFQCPACKSYYPLVEQIRSEYNDKIAYQFRNYPLVQIHPNAFVGARAAEAASKQGKFFDMYNLLYQNQDTWSQSSNPQTVLVSYAQQLGLNVEQFKTDMNSSAIADVINADVRQAQALGATATPTFVLNGKRIEKNPQSLDEFKKLIDDALAQNQ